MKDQELELQVAPMSNDTMEYECSAPAHHKLP